MSTAALQWLTGAGRGVRRGLCRGLCMLCLWLPAAAALAGGLDDRLLALERLGRAQPLAAASGLERLLPEAPPFSAQRLELLLVRGLLLAAGDDAPAALAVARELDGWADQGQAAEAAVAAVLVRAKAQTQNGDLRPIDGLLSAARAHWPPTLPPRMRLRYLVVHAGVARESGQLGQALRLYLEALQLCDRLAAPAWQVEVRSGLARLHLQAGEAARAQAVNREALEIAQRSADDYGLYRVHGTQAVLFDAAQEREGVRRELEAALAAARRADAPAAESLTLSNLSDVYLKRGEPATALAMAERALPLAQRLGDTDGETVALFNIGVARIALHDIEAGKRFVRRSIAIDERRGAFSSVAVSQHELGQVLEAAGDARGAVRAYHRYRDVADEILRRDQQKVMVELQERFDAERRGRAIEVLNRENAIKTEQLGRQDAQQQLSTVLAGVFVLCVGVLLLLSRRMRLSNRLLQASNQALAVQGERDPLTGLANRRHFHAVVAAPAAGLSGTLLIIDIDHFKRVNDRHGHAAGDAVLIEVARRLSGALRDGDLLARWGGEEFLLVARAIDAEQARALAARLLAALADAPVLLAGQPVHITASIGFARFPLAPQHPPMPLEAAIRVVDAALYRAKADGRNRACGVEGLRSGPGGGLEGSAPALETAVADGRATLAVVHGPAPLRAAA